MTTIITRLYANKTTAAKVVKALEDEGFMSRDFDVIEPPSGKPTAAQMRQVNEAMTAAHVFPSTAKTYAEHIKDGKSLVVVRPPFGATKAAAAIVDSFEPIDAGVKHQDAFVYPSSSGSIIRNRQLPGLLPSDARMFAGIFPLLTSGRPIFSGIPQVIKNTGKASLSNSRMTGFIPLIWRYRQS